MFLHSLQGLLYSMTCTRTGRAFPQFLEAAEVMQKPSQRMFQIQRPRGAASRRLQGPVNQKTTPPESKWYMADPGDCWTSKAIAPFSKIHTPWETVQGRLLE